MIYCSILVHTKTRHDWCASFSFSFPITKRTTQAPSVFPIPVPWGSALMWIKWRIITVGKDGHLPTVPGFHCIFFSFWGYLSALKEGEKNKISKPFQSWLTNLMWTYENKLIQGWDDSAYHTCSPSFDYNLWNLNEICSIQKNASISLVFCFQIKLHYIALFFLNYSCLVKGALL